MCITSCALLFAGPLGRPPLPGFFFLRPLRPGITRGAFLDTTTNESMDSCDMLGAVKVQLLRESEHQHRGMCSSKNIYIAGAPRQSGRACHFDVSPSLSSCNDRPGGAPRLTSTIPRPTLRNVPVVLIPCARCLYPSFYSIININIRRGGS